MSSSNFNEYDHPRFRGKFIKAFGHKEQPGELPPTSSYDSSTPPADYTAAGDAYYKSVGETIRRLNAGEKPVPDKPDTLSEDESVEWDDLVTEYGELQEKADDARKLATDHSDDDPRINASLSRRFRGATLLNDYKRKQQNISNRLRSMAGLDPLY